MLIEKVISGGQVGADQAGLSAARFYGIPTGGYAPKGYITADGPNTALKYLYGLEEIEGSYKERTWMNVHAADITIRLAVDFTSPGEKCTLNAILSYSKPFIDIPLQKAPTYIDETVNWILKNDFKIINIAGNSQGKFGYDIFSLSYSFLFYLFAHFTP